MLQCVLIGYLGADAEAKSSNGKDFITFRVAQTDKWTDEAGQTHEQTTWVDCVMNGRPNVFPYLKKGQQVYVNGPISLRVYSSAKERCMKAGLTINVRQVELIGGKSDDIPGQLFAEENGKQFNVEKLYLCVDPTTNDTASQSMNLVSKSGEIFHVDENGWIIKAKNEN